MCNACVSRRTCIVMTSGWASPCAAAASCAPHKSSMQHEHACTNISNSTAWQDALCACVLLRTFGFWRCTTCLQLAHGLFPSDRSALVKQLSGRPAQPMDWSDAKTAVLQVGKVRSVTYFSGCLSTAGDSLLTPSDCRASMACSRLRASTAGHSTARNTVSTFNH